MLIDELSTYEKCYVCSQSARMLDLLRGSEHRFLYIYYQDPEVCCFERIAQNGYLPVTKKRREDW